MTRTIWLLSLTSLCTDIASEMLYPVMPIYLKEIGFSLVLIGILEGCMEAVAGFSKGYFGRLSDIEGKRLPFVRVGYGLSAIAKPMIGLFTFAWWVFFARTLERLGKGIRTASRDAMLSAESTVENKASVFGFHRGMDTLGAAIGPILALCFLYMFPSRYQTLFFIAFIPGIGAILLTSLLKEKTISPLATATPRKTGFFVFLMYWNESSETYRKLLIGLLIFALFNSSDVFLLLMVKHRGYSDQAVIGLYIFYNLVYAITSYPIGTLTDKLGYKQTLIFGFLLFATVYAGMGFVVDAFHFILLFGIYGVYAACTEGISKAWISNLCPKNEVGSAIGLYTSFQSISALFASSFAGWIWYVFSPSVTFMISSIGTIFVVVYIGFYIKDYDK